jgi:ParB family chromosome partitioning protein
MWEPKEAGDMACVETWSASMSGLEAWETMAWRTRLEDGVLLSSATTGEPAWIDTEEMLACPRSRSSSWAELGTMASVPVVHPDGRVMAVLELARRQRSIADAETLENLMSVAVLLAERIAAIEEETEAKGARWEMSPRAARRPVSARGRGA